MFNRWQKVTIVRYETLGGYRWFWGVTFPGGVRYGQTIAWDCGENAAIQLAWESLTKRGRKLKFSRPLWGLLGVRLLAR
jgi:hypothetical protein